MDLEAVKTQLQAKLPAQYEPLLLSFYGNEVKITGDLILIGDDYGTKLFLDPRNRHISSIDDDGHLPTRFVNSSIDQMAACLSQYEQTRNSVLKTSSAAEQEHFVQALRQQLQAIDPAALDNPENWWCTVLEQLEMDGSCG